MVLALTPQELGIGQLFWHIRDAVVVADTSTERIVLWNPAAEALFGYTADEAVGMPIERLVPEALREQHRAGLARFRGGRDGTVINASRPVVLPGLRKDGQECTIELSLTPLVQTQADGVYVLAMLRDVSERKRWMDAVDELTKVVSPQIGQAFFDELTTFLARTLGVDAVLIGELFGEAKDRVRTAAYFLRGDLLAASEYPLAGTPCENMVGRNVCSYPSDVQTLFPDDSDLAHLGMQSYSGIPLFGGDGRPLGLIAAMHGEPLQDVAFADAVLRLVAPRAEAELERKQAEQALRERARRSALTADVSAALSRRGDLRQLLQDCTEALVRHLDAAFARIWTLNEAEQVLEMQASAGMYTHLDGPHGRVPVGKYKIGLIAEERRPHLSNDVQHDPRVGDREWACREGMVAFAGYPLLVEKRVVGVVAMFARHPLGETILQDLASAATAIAQCVERKRVEAQREQLVAQLETERAWLESVLKQMPGGVAIVEAPSGEVILTNAQIEELYQAPFAPPDQVNREAGYQLLHQDGSPYACEELPLTRAIQWGETVEAAEMLLVRGDGARRIIRASSAPIRAPDGHVIAAAGTYHDVTPQKEAEEALAQRAADLARSNEELERFAYVASHDLQEPLRVVVSYLQLLERRYKGQLDARADKYIGHAVEGAKRMQRLINDLLAYSRVGRTGKEFAPTDVEAVLERVAANLQTAAEESGATITHDPLPTVIADASQLGQLFQNLIGNAIKFRGEEPPRVHVSARRQAQEWIFSIQDNGIGIDESYNDRIFIIFQRLHGRDEYPGTGIGLAICKKIVERHGGRIWVESAAGNGSTFYFTIPDNGGSSA